MRHPDVDRRFMVHKKMAIVPERFQRDIFRSAATVYISPIQVRLQRRKEKGIIAGIEP